VSEFEENPVQREEVTPPPQFEIQSPPELEPPPSNSPPKTNKFKKRAGPIATAAAAILAKLKTIGLFLVTVLKYFKFGKILLTSGSMLISIALYSFAFGWKFALGFVLCIFVHEMGHVYVAYRQGLPISAPVFIPFMGAVIFNKRGSDSAWAQAIMGIGGPVAGTMAGLVCWGIFSYTGNMFFLALAYVTFFMNLFNMTPMVPLDGGWITLAVSPYLWMVGLAALLVMFFTGHLTNPLIFVLVILSLPRLWTSLKTGNAVYGLQQATPNQRWIMGVCYVALGGFLFMCMSATNLERFMQKRESTPQVAEMGIETRFPHLVLRASPGSYLTDLSSRERFGAFGLHSLTIQSPLQKVTVAERELSHRMPVERRVAARGKVLQLPFDI
jgi:Zn-dependent protease